MIKLNKSEEFSRPIFFQLFHKCIYFKVFKYRHIEQEGDLRNKDVIAETQQRPRDKAEETSQTKQTKTQKMGSKREMTGGIKESLELQPPK